MIPYLMQTTQDCGPRALSAMTHETWERIMAAWPGGWRESGFGKAGTPNDTPWDHFGCLEKLGRKYRVVDLGMVLSGACLPGKTAILIHFQMPESGARGILTPLWRAVWPTLRQHWVILKEVSSHHVTVWYGGAGPDQTRTWSLVEFRQLYAAGWPACAYEIDKGDGRLTRWQRFIASTTGRFA